MGVLGHLSALISVKEHVVNVERGGHEGLVVGVGDLLGAGAGGEVRDGPQALINRADVKVDLDLVVLESDEGKCKTGVTAEPELEGHVKGGLGKGVARSAHLARGGRVARAIDRREGWVSDVGKLGGVTDHLVVPRPALERVSWFQMCIQSPYWRSMRWPPISTSTWVRSPGKRPKELAEKYRSQEDYLKIAVARSPLRKGATDRNQPGR